MLTGYALTQKRSRIRRKIRDRDELDDEDLELLPDDEQRWLAAGTWEENYTPRKRWVYYGHDRRLQPKLDELRGLLSGLFERYLPLLDGIPDLTDRRTLVAFWVLWIRHASSRHDVMRAITEIGKLMGHYGPRRAAVESPPDTPERLEAEIRQVLRRHSLEPGARLAGGRQIGSRAPLSHHGSRASRPKPVPSCRTEQATEW